jgi:hypothetical protein
MLFGITTVKIINYAIGAGVLGIGYLIVVFLFDILLRGFYPFIPSRPWVVDQILENLAITHKNPKMLALSSGRSGFFRALELKYKNAKEFTGVELGFFPFFVAKVQVMIRNTKIKVIKSEVHRLNVGDYDFIYSHLDPDQIRGLGKKLKFECKPGTLIVSTGFNIPYLTPAKIIDLPDRKGRYDFLTRNQNLFQSKRKKFKKEKKAYFYEI